VYNNRNFQTQKIASDETIMFSYDSAGNRQTMTDVTGLTKYDYYPTTGSLKTVTSPDNNTVNYQYDVQGRRSQMTDPFSQTLYYGYNNMNRLTGVSTIANPTSADNEAQYQYYKNGLMKNVQQKNGISTAYTYDDGRLTNLIHKQADGTILNSYSYTYDNNANIQTKTENANPTNNFTYDELNRIKTSDQLNETYSYDNRGNRQTYQNNINLDSSDATYGYDKRDRLASVATTDGKNVSYKYNGDGLLYERTENGTTTRFYYDGTSVIAEANVVNGVAQKKAQYIRGGSSLIARQDASGNKEYYLENGHNDVVELRDSNGVRLNQYTYDIWGNPLTTNETVENPFRYSGEYYDKSSSLQYLRARWYDPSVGRFINEDTYEGDIKDPLSLNLYSYVENNPLIHSDPSGHCFWDLCIVEGTLGYLAIAGMFTAAVGAGIGVAKILPSTSAAPKEAPTVTVPNKTTLTVLPGGNNSTNSNTDSSPKAIPYYNPDDDKDKDKRNIVYRALNAFDPTSMASGNGIVAKNPNGTWTPMQHILNGSQRSALTNDPWISTTPDLSVAQGYAASSGGLGIVAIDLNKVPSLQVVQSLQGYNVSSSSSDERLAYQRAVWSMEISIYQRIPQEAILGYVK
jgi:RHS repeat-associated protein